MNRSILSFLLSLIICLGASAQLKIKKPKIKKPKKLNIMEGIGNMAGNLMTGKTDQLGNVSVSASYISGMYSPDIETTEGKYFPDNLVEGDHLVMISFFKQEGAGLLELKNGTVQVNGETSTYHGLGSYGYYFDEIPDKPVDMQVQAENGDQANLRFYPTQAIEIISVNGETALPVLDLAEDIEVEYYNPPGSEGTTVKVSLLTKVMGVRAFNHFADFKVKEAGNVKVTIPKEALANPEIVGQLNVGNFDKGENYLVMEREVLTERDEFDEFQKPGDIPSIDLTSRSYASFPVIVKGKQEDGLIVSLKVRGQTPDKSLRYDFYKPNANTGIPFSKASKFGLASFTMEAKTYSKETESSSSSWSVGGTRYTETTTTTTILDFPELPESYWENTMDQIYQEVVSFFKSEYNVDFAPVEDMTSSPNYQTLFPAKEKVNDKVVRRSYENTSRTQPQGLSEIFGSISSNQTADNPRVNLMKEAGDVDGMLSMHLSLVIAENKAGNIVLIPSLTLSIAGRDETRDDKEGTYLNGLAQRNTGEPYNEELLKANPEELLRVCSVDQLLHAVKQGVATLKAKEVEMGYDRIWSIGE